MAFGCSTCNRDIDSLIMLVTAYMIKDVAQLLAGGAGNPGSREVLSPTNLVLEPPARLAPQTLNMSLLLIATQPG